ncbi:hypothetical protein ACIXIR_07990 [Bacteroides fragilis]
MSSERHAPAEPYVHRMPDFLTDKQRIPPKLKEITQKHQHQRSNGRTWRQARHRRCSKSGNKDNPDSDQPEKPKPRLKL